MIIIQKAINPEYIKMRWQEPYVSGGLNQKSFGVIPAGIYHGFKVTPGPTGREITVSTDDPFYESGDVSGYGAGSHDNAAGYSIAVYSDRRGTQSTIQIDMGVSGQEVFDLTGYDNQELFLVVRPRFVVGSWTDGYLAVVTSDEIDDHPQFLVIAAIAVPGIGTDIAASHITYDHPDYPRTQPFATWDKWGFMQSKYVRKIDSIEQLMFKKLTGGGTIGFASNLVSWAEDIRIYIPGRDDDYYVSGAGSVSLPNNGDVAYVVIPHETPMSSLPVYVDSVADVAAESVSGMSVPLFFRAQNRIYSGDGGLSLEDQEETPDGIDANIPADVMTLLGITETSTVWGFTNNFAGVSTQNAPERWSSLDVDDENLHEDRNVIMSCSGNISWSAAAGMLTWNDPIQLMVPNEIGDFLIYPAAVPGIDDGEVLYVTMDRDAVEAGDTTLTAAVAANGSLPLNTANKNHYVIGYRNGDRFVFRNGFVWSDGESHPFQNSDRFDDNLRWDSVMHRMTISGDIVHLNNVSGQISWEGSLYIRSMSGNLFYTVDPGLVTLYDDEMVAYVEFERDIDITPKLLWTYSSAVVTSVGAASWTGSLVAGDWIKKKGLRWNRYYRIASVDSASQVTLEEVIEEATSPVVGDKSQYAKTELTVQVAHRSNVDPDVFWLFFRDDLASPKARIQVRDLGELARGEKIATTNWVYEESEIADDELSPGDILTLPNDSRDGDDVKYYKVGSGDLEVYHNFGFMTKERVIVTDDFALTYNTITGFVSVSGGVDITKVSRGDYLIDALGDEFYIEGKINSVSGTFFIGTGQSVDTGFGAYVFRHDYEEIGVEGEYSNTIRLRRYVSKNATMTYRLQPINRPYSDGTGSGPIPDTVTGVTNLQEAYDGGHIIYVSGPATPVTIVGSGSGKAFRVLGDMEVTGVIDPKGLTLLSQTSDPASGLNTLWYKTTGDLMFQDTIRGKTHTISEQGLSKVTYQNTTGSSLLSGRLVVKDGVGKMKYASWTSELLSNVIGVLMQDVGNLASGYVQRLSWVDGSLFTTSCFVEVAFPSDGVAVWLNVDGKMSVSGPTTGSGNRALRMGIWDEGGLLIQIRDFGLA